jgi:hypothetical protein
MQACTCKPFSTCFEFQHETRKIATCADEKNQRTKYIYHNDSNDFLSKYRVDGCLIADDKEKCDFLLLNCNKQQAYFIELKGTDLGRAIKQIDRSIDLLKPEITNFAIFARIVLVRLNTPDLKRPELVKLENKVKELNGDLKKQSQQMEERN